MRDLCERHSFNDKPQAHAAENFAYAYGSPLNDHSPTLDFSFKTKRELHIESGRVSEYPVDLHGCCQSRLNGPMPRICGSFREVARESTGFLVDFAAIAYSTGVTPNIGTYL